jgi:hypothetical protein
MSARAPLSSSVRRQVEMVREFVLATILISTLLLIACTQHQASDFEVNGWSRMQLVEEFGKPDSIQLRSAHNYEGYMGPRPKFIESLPPGDDAEVWVYKVKDGNVDVFFYEDDIAIEVVFTRNDVMY